MNDKMFYAIIGHDVSETNLYDDRYTKIAHGKSAVHTVYAKTCEEVEPLLEHIIIEVR